jgi:hypothetical protein
MVQSKRHVMFYIRGLVWQEIIERSAIHGGTNNQHDLYDDLLRHRRHRDAVHNPLREVEGAQCQHHRVPQHRRKRFEFEAKMEFVERHFVLRLRRLVGQHALERLAAHECTDGERDLYVDLHWHGRQRLTVRDRLRQVADAHRQPQRRSQCGHQRQQFDFDMVGHQCHLLQRLRCLVGRPPRERITIHGCADGKSDLHVDLHRRGRECFTVRDGVGDVASTHCQS